MYRMEVSSAQDGERLLYFSAKLVLYIANLRRVCEFVQYFIKKSGITYYSNLFE